MNSITANSCAASLPCNKKNRSIEENQEAELYSLNGFLHLRNFFHSEHLVELEVILEGFHNSWLADNASCFESGAIKSHSPTSNTF